MIRASLLVLFAAASAQAFSAVAQHGRLRSFNKYSYDGFRNDGSSQGRFYENAGRPQARFPGSYRQSSDWWDRAGSADTSYRTNTGSFETYTDTVKEQQYGREPRQYFNPRGRDRRFARPHQREPYDYYDDNRREPGGYRQSMEGTWWDRAGSSLNSVNTGQGNFQTYTDMSSENARRGKEYERFQDYDREYYNNGRRYNDRQYDGRTNGRQYVDDRRYNGNQQYGNRRDYYEYDRTGGRPFVSVHEHKGEAYYGRNDDFFY
uniref:Uncharacterized protein n=2 Tax=Entomoneis paludosa TaxID=265537 RepID=A0A7S2YGQ8_9STRA|mmetsp:Transcript_31991/g.66768  ORF Transcript_31991/g.66768 Transcript_31991/m.66768 type:complete len:262 (+) Transcript_31991:148-933(+)|eukprot:CAMPEP_0172457008 /NCGR_PEP_ID=MMETSP1065-20121228/19269_1 /TAXON_ID=265537 /ORGANISM="Amphiprora paludosa, Strain CCMP125" /LENGTH=261 /DNA_ID=CAMNT_0013210425 /DNA_START=110 /DNA_END=895 /DNA_ORIENTATION=+